jgi:probable phosphoglycerate mutase
MILTLMRHGETEMNVLGKTNGQRIDDHLTEKGESEIKEMRGKLTSDFARIIASDLTRTRETAEIINEVLHKEIEYREALREIDLGDLTGRSWAEIVTEHGDAILREYLHQEYDFRAFGGEEAHQVKERVFACLHDIVQKYKGEKVLIVTHGGIIRMLHFFLHQKLFEIIENGTLHEFEIE